jgi:hypothetical protein
MKINKNQYRIRIILSIVFGLLCFSGQASALSRPVYYGNFAIVSAATGGSAQSTDPCQTSPGTCSIVQEYINPLIKFLSALVGIAVVMSVVIGGIQYSAARDDPQAVGAAKKRISNAIFALIVYLFLFALLNFLVPGGLL